MPVASTPPELKELFDLILAENPNHIQFLTDSLETISAEDYADLLSYQQYLLSQGESMDYMAACYNMIVQDMFEEQIYFMRHKKYRHASKDEVAEQVYHNPEYMKKYMHGLAFTLFLWPTHREIRHFFLDTFPYDMIGKYLEIGPGHGMYFMTVLRDAAFSTHKAIDLSETSLRLTREIIESDFFGDFSGFELTLADFFDIDFGEETFEALVTGEVLEHVDNPKDFLSKIREITTPDSYIYVTTCINAPAVDHVSLFESIDELKELTASAGLSWVRECATPYPRLTLEETLDKRMPLNIGMILGHQ